LLNIGQCLDTCSVARKCFLFFVLVLTVWLSSLDILLLLGGGRSTQFTWLHS
jgi:hypothetical protein